MANLIIILVLLAIFSLVIFKMVKNKKEGKTSCGCGCSGCAMAEKCHKD